MDYQLRLILITIFKSNYKNKKKYVTVFVLIITFLVFSIINDASGNNITFPIFISFFANAIFISYMLYCSIKKHAYSCLMIQWLYCLIFLVVAGFIQLTLNWSTWGYVWNHDMIVKTNLIVFMWSLFVFLGDKMSSKSKIKLKYIKPVHLTTMFMIFLAIIAVLITIYFLSQNGIIGIFDKSVRVVASNSSVTINALIEQSFQAFMTFTAIFSIVKYKKQRKFFPLMVVCCLCLLITFFPLSIPRYATGSIYGCALLIFFPKFKINRKYIFLFFFTFIFLFPLLNFLRYGLAIDINANNLRNDTSFSLARIDFDSYQMLMAAQDTVQKIGISYGKQFLSGLLFFVPRVLWPTKSVASTSVMYAELDNLHFDNSSCPLIAEGYLNGGVIGVIILGFLYGYVFGKIDKYYWSEKATQNSYLGMLYPLIVNYQLFYMRGAFMYVHSYLTAFVVIYTFMFLFAKMQNNFE